MRMMTGLGALTGLACIVGPASATSPVQSSFGVSLTIAAECVINGSTTLDFGSTGVINANNDKTNTIKIQCTNSTPYDIGLDKGLNGSSTAQRLLLNAVTSETVKYNLYTLTGRATVWGNVVGTDTVGKTGNGDEQIWTIFGRIPAQTTPTPGSYADTVTFTITY
jgi:spore coat protein U domain-containing protein, fimbrial subunit CupE1/2/3/6